MEREPVPLERPLVILGGYRMPFIGTSVMASRLAAMTSGDRDDVLGVHYMLAYSIERAADIAIRAIEAKWPSDDPTQTIEVDVVGISMGGIVARYAARAPVEGEDAPPKRLRIARLFTIASPHRGAEMAGFLAPDRAAREMLPDSPFLARLDETLDEDGYELVCYARTHDMMVGARRSAPPGREPYWVEGPIFLSHLTVTRDWRFLVDIARRLRGEAPLALEASEPPRN